MKMREDWVGRAIDGFPLERFLAGGAHSSVFLTRYEARPAAIKVVPADAAQLRRWTAASKLSHPNLIRILTSGRGRIADREMIYVVMEYAEEDLSQVLPDRALNAAETRDMLTPALAALKYLHDNGFVHSRLKPSNIMAAGDCLKLSSDGIRRAGESSDRGAGPDDPPERGPYSPAWDVWALGVVIIEVLTQRRQGAAAANLPDPFATIVDHCLQPDPSNRWTVPRISGYLGDPGEAAPGRRFITPVGVWIILAIAAIAIAGAIFSRRETLAPTPAQPAAQISVPEPAAASQPAPAKLAPEPKASRKTGRPQPEAAPPAEAPADQPMPEILAQARSSIRGRVRVIVKLDVDASGAVTNATLASPASSKYFADRTLEAARKWKFPPAGAPQQWDVQFEFRPSGTKVTPRRLSP